MSFKLFLITIILSTSSFAYALNTINITNTSQENLNIDSQSLLIGVSHPGKSISGVCSLEIVSDSYHRSRPISELVEALIISGDERKIDIVSSTVARVDLVSGLFVDTLYIETKNGLNFSEVIEETLGVRRTVIVRPRSCN